SRTRAAPDTRPTAPLALVVEDVRLHLRKLEHEETEPLRRRVPTDPRLRGAGHTRPPSERLGKGTPMLRIAGLQFIGNLDRAANAATAERLGRGAAARRAKIACLPWRVNTMYFCVETKPEYFEWAEPVPGPTTERMGALARDLGIVVIAPVFEKAPDGRYFNAAAVLGPDGRCLGKYRKSSIPFMDVSQSAEPRGNEKYYFTPGDLGFPTFDTPFARIGILICY